MTCGIYLIENKINNKKYVGQSMNVEKRMFQNHRECNVLHNAIKKYGKNNFEIKTIVYCEREELNRLEIALIKVFMSHISQNGYNISWGGDAPMMARKHTEQTKIKMKKSHSSEKYLGENNPFHNKKHNSKSREKMSLARKGSKNPNYGKIASNETREKMSKKLKGRILSLDWKEKIGSANKGKKRTEEQKQKEANRKSNVKNSLIGTKRKNSSSKYFGVFKENRGKYISWRARITQNNKTINIGSSRNEIDAAIMYDEYIVKNNIDRPLNFPERFL